jgi:tripartite-type tricarboxylate transporter receptor subunit TctC
MALGRSIKMAALMSGVLAVCLAGEAQAQAYPQRAVKVIVPFAAGGPTDVTARVVGQRLSEKLGQQFVVENRPGAGGNIGISAVAKSPPDGYTLLAVSSAYVVNTSLYPNAPYDAFKDFAPITLAVDAPNILSVNPSFPAKTVAELIAHVKANPGKYSMATSGIGTTPHLAGELFRTSLKLDLVNAPFNGAAPALQSMLQGQTPIGITSMGNSTELFKSGQLRPLAVLAAKRAAVLPDVPASAEAGLPGQESNTLQSFLAPAGTPREIVATLHREIVAALAIPEVRGQFEGMGFVVVANTPEQFGEIIKADVARWGKLIKDQNIKVE